MNTHRHYLMLALLLVSLASAAQPEKIFLSRDQGKTWRSLPTGIAGDDFVNAWTVHEKVVMVGTEAHGIYISTDGLKSWHASNNGLPHDVKIDALASYNNVVFAGSYRHGVFLSYDRGNTWVPSNSGLENLTVRCFYRFNNIVFAGTNGGIYTSVDHGHSWTHASDRMQVNTFTSFNGVLFAGTNFGLLISANGGQSWSWRWKKGAISSIDIDGNEIVAVLFDRQIYVSSDRGTTWVLTDPYFNRYTFQITPSGERIPAGPWRDVLRFLPRDPVPFYSGLPNIPFGKLLETPYGVLITMGGGGC